MEARHRGLRIRLVPSDSQDIVAQIRAGQGFSPFDAMPNDEPPHITAMAEGYIGRRTDAALPNLGSVFPDLLARSAGFGVPATYSLAGIAYNSQMVRNPPTSWADLWRPEYRGRVGIARTSSNLGLATLAIAAKSFGGGKASLDIGWEKLRELQPRQRGSDRRRGGGRAGRRRADAGTGQRRGRAACAGGGAARVARPAGHRALPVRDGELHGDRRGADAACLRRRRQARRGGGAAFRGAGHAGGARRVLRDGGRADRRAAALGRRGCRHGALRRGEVCGASRIPAWPGDLEEFAHSQYWATPVTDLVVVVAAEPALARLASEACDALAELGMRCIAVDTASAPVPAAARRVTLPALPTALAPLATAIPLQALAHGLARASGLDPDTRLHLKDDAARFRVSRLLTRRSLLGTGQ
jgi:hypothetical protein